MTTRRRRTPSENYNEENPVVVPTTQPVLSPTTTLLSPNTNQINVPWLAIGNPVNPNQAYYKKTDSPSGNIPQNPQSYGGIRIPQASAFSQTPNFNNSNNYSVQQQWPVNQYPGNYGNTVNSVSNNTNYQSGYGVNPNEGISLNSGIDLTDTSDMASRDRTQEFVRIIRSQQGNHSNGVAHRANKKTQDLRQYTAFMQRSKLIGRNISSTYAKLEKLTLLAKKRSLFDDSQDLEIQELTGIIRHDLNSLTKQLEDLRSRSKAQLSTNNGPGHLQKHSANLVGSLQNKVKSITQQFKSVLEVRTENLKKQAERRDQFTGGAVSGALPIAAVSGHHQGSVLVADEVASADSEHLVGATGGEVAINMGGGGMYQNQLHLMEEQDTLLQARADTMKTIESTIVELGQMFTQLADMVKEQEELVTRIDSNVEDTLMNVEAGHSEILKYFKSVSSNRWLMIKVFGIMIVFFVIFVVFMT